MEFKSIPESQYKAIKDILCSHFDQLLDQAQNEGDVLNIIALAELAGFGWYTHDFMQKWEEIKKIEIEKIQDVRYQDKYDMGIHV